MNNTTKFLALAVGAAVVTPLVLPLVAPAARPLGRAAARAGGVVYDKTRETAAELMEIAEDFYAEARVEYEQRNAAEAAAAAEAAETVEEAADTAPNAT